MIFPNAANMFATGNHRYGKAHCIPHRINESNLDRIIGNKLRHLREEAEKNYASIEADVRRWMEQKSTAEEGIHAL